MKIFIGEGIQPIQFVDESESFEINVADPGDRPQKPIKTMVAPDETVDPLPGDQLEEYVSDLMPNQPVGIRMVGGPSLDLNHLKPIVEQVLAMGHDLYIYR